MASDQFKDALRLVGWTQRQFAGRMGVDEATVSRWASGRLPVPQYVAEYMRVVVAVSEVMK